MQQAEGPVDTTFDRYARLVRRALGVPVALVSLVEETRQVFVGAEGLPEPYRTTRETPLSHSFCQYVVRDQQPLVVTDARADGELSDNLAIRDLGVVAYAGWPITDHTGLTVGSLCAIDDQPRAWRPDELETLRDLAVSCSAEISEHHQHTVADAALHEARALGERSRVLLALSQELAATRTLADIARAVEQVAVQQLGCHRAGLWLRDVPGGRLDVLSLPPVGARPEVLRHVASPGSQWRAGELLPEMPLDGSNPVGAAVVEGEPIFFRTMAARDDRFRALAPRHQVGEARAFVPLTVGADTYGSLLLVWPLARHSDEDDRTTIEALATYTAQAIQRAMLLEERMDVSLTLQNAMLTRLQQPEHLTVAARYLPAAARDDVGGDWYDLVLAPTGTVHLMIGDVAGHDMDAAATMGQLRSMLRTLVWGFDEPPAKSVERLDQAARELGVATVASLVVTRIEQPEAEAALGLRTLRWTNAGHLPPLLLGPDGAARYLEAQDRQGSLLGVRPHGRRDDVAVPIAPGSLLLLYTDGLVERRGENVDAGLDRLRAAATRHAGLDADPFLDAVIDDLVPGRRDDDLAALAVRFHHPHL